MKHAFVTGATGFVGRWLVRELWKRDTQVTAIIRPNSFRTVFLPEIEGMRVIRCAMESYSELPSLLDKAPESIFFHLAWDGVYGPKRISLDTQLKNIAASKAAVEAAVALGCSRFIGLGSIMELEAVAVADADGTRPAMTYIYGEAKHTAHLVTKAIAATLGIEHVWPILTNPYGELDDSTRFVNMVLMKILHHEPLEFTSGTQVYDFIHIEDAVHGLISVAELGKPFHNYILGSGKPAPLRRFVETIGREMAPDRELIFGSVPYTGVQLDTKKLSIESLTRDTGFVPQVPFTEGIHRTMTWMKEKENM